MCVAPPQAYKGTVIAVTHDRYFLDNIAGWILEVDRGALLPFKGNYTQWLENKRTRLNLERSREAAQARALEVREGGEGEVRGWSEHSLNGLGVCLL
jgi:ATPase subunit of ABC transporter with duplicated ATPase domains